MSKETESNPYWAGIGAHKIFNEGSFWEPVAGTIGWFADNGDDLREKVVNHAEPWELKIVDSRDWKYRYSPSDNPDTAKYKLFMPATAVYRVIDTIPGSWDGNHHRWGIFEIDEDKDTQKLIEEIA